MSEQSITLTMSKPDAEVLLGVLSSERYNAEVEAVCDALRKQLDEMASGSPAGPVSRNGCSGAEQLGRVANSSSVRIPWLSARPAP